MRQTSFIDLCCLCRNVLLLGEASERNSAGPSTPIFITGGTTSGNLYILVLTPTKKPNNLSLPHLLSELYSAKMQTGSDLLILFRPFYNNNNYKTNVVF